MRLVRLLIVALLLAACGGDPSDHEPAAEPAGGDPSVDWDAYTSYSRLLELAGDPEASTYTAKLDDFIAEAFVNAPDNADTQTKVLYMVWYVHSHFESVEPEPAFTPTRALEQRTSQCGGSAFTLQLMARRLGLPTRGAGFFGVPRQGGHTAVEIFWDGAWHYVDPSFGAFFTSDGTIDSPLLSLDTVLKYRQIMGGNALYAQSKGRLGKEYPDPNPTDIYAVWGPEQTAMPGSGDYNLFLPNAVAGTPYVPGRILETIYPIDAAAGDVALGEPDNSIDDLSLHVGPRGWFDGSSLYFVGDYSSSHGPLVGHLTFDIGGVAPGDVFTWKSTLFFGETEYLQASLRKAEILKVVRSNDSLTITGRALRDHVELRLTSDDDTRVMFDSHRFGR